MKQVKNIKLNQEHWVINLLLLIAVAITIIGFLVDLKNTLTYPGIDLRNRVVGARLMLEGIDPYFFKWQPEFSELFYDPFDVLDVPTQLFSKLSVPPTVVVLHSLFARLPYLQQKIIWLFVQWAALIGTILIFIKTSSCQVKTNLTLITSFLFANSLFWRFHINSGQIYILYVFLLSVAWLCLKQQSIFYILLSGLFVGITASLRPPFALFFIPFIISGEYLFVLSGIFGTAASVGLSLLVTGISIWKQYLLTILSMTGFVELKPLPLNESISSDFNITYPTIVEGFDWNIRNPLERYLDTTSLYHVLKVLDIPYKQQILVISFVATIIFLSLCVWKFYFKNKDVSLLFLWGTSICLVGEFFIPVNRYPYYDIQMMLPLLIIIDIANVRNLIYRKNITILLLGLLLSIVGFIVVPKAMFFSPFLIMLYIVWVSFLVLVDSNNTTVTKMSKKS